MDNRWTPTPVNSKRGARVILHPVAAQRDVRLGVATDGIDVSSNVSRGTYSPTTCNLQLSWNDEFYGVNQPSPTWVVEVREEKQVLWIGYISNLSSFTVEFGKRQFNITARSRDQWDTWKLVQIVTNLYPQGTNFTSIITDIAQAVGLYLDEINVPASAYLTAHMNTQLGNISAWQAITTIMLPMGLTPFINSLGVLKGISRDTNGRTPDIILTPERVIKINANRAFPPTTRVILTWRDPNLTMATQLPKKLGEATMTSGFFLPYLFKDVWFSDDKTQRAMNTYMIVRQSANALYIPVCIESYSQTNETEGRIQIFSLGYTQAIVALALYIQITGHLPDGAQVAPPTGTGVTIPKGKTLTAYADYAMALTLMAIGTGIYEIWGTPYDIIHAKNISEAYDSSSVPWLDNPQNIDCDLITNEAHAQAVCTRELYYEALGANSWSATIVDDRRIEPGDILQFPDGSSMYVQDFTRDISFGTPSTLEVKGFLVAQSS